MCDLFAIAKFLFDTRILIRKCGNLPTFKPLSSPSLTQQARQTLPRALLMEMKRETQIKRRHLSDLDAVHCSY